MATLMGTNTRNYLKKGSLLRPGQDGLELGEEALVDEGVWLGYPPVQGRAAGPLIIGPGARIRFGTVIYAGTRIGRNLETGHHVVIREGNIIGDNLCIWSNSSVDYGCIIGNNVKLHHNVHISQFTTIEDDVFISAGSVLLNDLHPGCPRSRDCLRGPTIRRGAQVGVNVSILPRVTIGEYALIGSGSVVTRDVPPRSVAYGNPARVHGRIEDLTCPLGLLPRPYGG